jgi:methylmalonyl-CoA mutase N-terminal domain/subunit
MESKIVSYDPKLSFLSETTPDGQANPDFDPDKTEEINARYLQMVGFKQYQKTDEQGRPLFTRDGQPLVVNTVGRTDISYEKFARAEVKRLEKWASERADERADETRENITKQRKNQGIRPGGGKRRSLGALQPGDISRMSEEELEKNEDAIMSQIDNMLGL